MCFQYGNQIPDIYYNGKDFRNEEENLFKKDREYCIINSIINLYEEWEMDCDEKNKHERKESKNREN